MERRPEPVAERAPAAIVDGGRDEFRHLPLTIRWMDLRRQNGDWSVGNPR